MKKIHILGQELKLPETVEEFDAMSKSTEPLPSFGVYDAAIKSFQDSVIQHLIGLTNQEQGKLSNAEFVACLLVSGSITEAQLEEVCKDFAAKIKFNPGQPEVGSVQPSLADLDHTYRKGIITAWEYELKKLVLVGRLTQEEFNNIAELIYTDIRENTVPSKE
jgi:hypothetical protein